MSSCPCCGKAVSPLKVLIDFSRGRVVYKDRVAYLTNRETQLVYALHQAMPRALSVGQIISAIYGHGEPEDSENCVRLYVLKARKALAPIGLKIVNYYMHGYALEKT